MANKGRFKPKNPQKYKGNANNIIYRSQWECSYLMKLDNDPDVLWYQSEEVIVPYSHPISGSYRRYFPDLVFEKRLPDKTTKVFMIEIKPAYQCKPPVKKEGSKSNRKFLKETVTFAENMAKWESARRYCAKRGWEFQVLTEKELKQWADK